MRTGNKTVKSQSVVTNLKSTLSKSLDSQSGINMVDLMMWLVIAALMLATAIQGIGYYHKTALVYQLSSDVSTAGTNIIKEATNTGAVTSEVAAEGIRNTETSSNETVLSKSVMQDGYFIVFTSHPDITSHDVVYSSAERNGLKTGVNLVPKGQGVPGVRIPNMGEPIDGKCSEGQWKGEYYGNKDLSGTPLGLTCEDAINNTWVFAPPAIKGMPADQFSIRWTKEFTAPKTENYLFDMEGDDGSKIILDGVVISDRWGDTAQRHNVTKQVTAGTHKLTIEYRENYYNAVARFKYNPVP